MSATDSYLLLTRDRIVWPLVRALLAWAWKPGEHADREPTTAELRELARLLKPYTGLIGAAPEEL